MTARAATERETWLDLLKWVEANESEPVLYTRAEIADMASGIDPVTPDDIRYWEYQGVLPRSIRRRYGGATRAVYPAWYAGLAREVRALQRQGHSLEEIKPEIRKRAIQGALWQKVSTTSVDPTPKPSPTLLAELDQLANDLGKQVGSAPTHIEVSITLTNGHGETYNFRITEDEDQQ